MTRVDIVSLVREGKGYFEWSEVRSEHGGRILFVPVFRDALKFDQQPEMKWDRTITSTSTLRDGVRLPATAFEMQQIADMLSCWLPTPKVLDLVWQQAVLRFDPVVNLGPDKIVATQPIHLVHDAIEKKVVSKGGYPEAGIVASVGKYWVVSNALKNGGKYGVATACNYGWHSSGGAYAAVTPGLKVWQGQGTQHNDQHLDPSQVVRLMHRFGRLVHPDGSYETIDLALVAADADLAPLLNHDGILHVTRQPSVPPQPSLPEPAATVREDGTIEMPEIVIRGSRTPSV